MKCWPRCAAKCPTASRTRTRPCRRRKRSCVPISARGRKRSCGSASAQAASNRCGRRSGAGRPCPSGRPTMPGPILQSRSTTGACAASGSPPETPTTLRSRRPRSPRRRPWPMSKRMTGRAWRRWSGPRRRWIATGPRGSGSRTWSSSTCPASAPSASHGRCSASSGR